MFYFHFDFFETHMFLDMHGERISVSCLTVKYFGRWFDLKSIFNLSFLLLLRIISYWEANDMDICMNQLLTYSSSVSCFTVSAQFLGRWVDQLKIVTDRRMDILAFYIRRYIQCELPKCVCKVPRPLGWSVENCDGQTDRRMDILAFYIRFLAFV